MYAIQVLHTIDRQSKLPSISPSSTTCPSTPKEEAIEQIRPTSSGSNAFHAASLLPAGQPASAKPKIQLSVWPEVVVVVTGTAVAVIRRSVAVDVRVCGGESVEEVEGVEGKVRWLLANGLGERLVVVCSLLLLLLLLS